MSTDPEDLKLLTLARAAQARQRADTAAAVRDLDGRTYAATAVALPSLALSALQVAVAMALSSGALGFEAAVLLDGAGVGDGVEPDALGRAAVADVSADAPVYLGNGDALVRLGRP